MTEEKEEKIVGELPLERATSIPGSKLTVQLSTNPTSKSLRPMYASCHAQSEVLQS